MTETFIYLFIFVLEGMILWQYTSKFFESRHTVKIKIMVLTSAYFILFLFSFLKCAWLNAALFLFLNFIFLNSQFKMRWHSALFHSAVITAVMAMCEFIVSGFMLYFSPGFFAESRDYLELALFSAFSKLLYFFILYMMFFLMKANSKLYLKQSKTIILFGLVPLSSLFVMLTFVSIGRFVSIPPALDWMVAFSAVLLLCANLIVFGINEHNRQTSTEFTEIQIQLQKESYLAKYYETLATQRESQSILIHDIKKHLQTIELLNDKKDHAKISDYIHQLMSSSQLRQSARLCSHEILNAILSQYKQNCDSNSIAFHADIRHGTTDFISDYYLTSLFGNLLDNAIKASKGVSDAFIEITARKNENTPLVVITMTNSCGKTPYLRFGKLSTLKPHRSRHGFGLKSIQTVIDKYGGTMYMYYDQNSLTFHTIITLSQLLIQ